METLKTNYMSISLHLETVANIRKQAMMMVQYRLQMLQVIHRLGIPLGQMISTRLIKMSIR